MFDRGNTSNLTLLQAQAERTDKPAEGRTLPEQTRQLKAELAGLEQKQAQMRAEFLKTAADARVKALQRLALADQALQKERERDVLRHLRASASGTMQDLFVHTLEGVGHAAEQLSTLVPDDTPLELEAVLPNREAGFVKVGQKAEVKREAFLFTWFGTVPGAVRLVGQEASAEMAPAPED